MFSRFIIFQANFSASQQFNYSLFSAIYTSKPNINSKKNRSDPQKDLQKVKFSLIFAFRNRGVEQLVARWAHNPKAAGSSPAPAT